MKCNNDARYCNPNDGKKDDISRNYSRQPLTLKDKGICPHRLNGLCTNQSEIDRQAEYDVKEKERQIEEEKVKDITTNLMMIKPEILEKIKLCFPDVIIDVNGFNVKIVSAKFKKWVGVEASDIPKRLLRLAASHLIQIRPDGIKDHKKLLCYFDDISISKSKITIYGKACNFDDDLSEWECYGTDKKHYSKEFQLQSDRVVINLDGEN